MNYGERNDRKAQLEKVLETITFENKARYDITIKAFPGQFEIWVIRQVICSISGKPIPVSNPQILPLNATIPDFIKMVFMAVGQFEAHEFCESFRVSGVHAYFPHKEGETRAHFGKGNRINELIMYCWEDVVKNRSDLAISMRFVNSWFSGTLLGRFLIWGSETMERAEKYTDHLIRVGWGKIKKWWNPPQPVEWPQASQVVWDQVFGEGLEEKLQEAARIAVTEKGKTE